MSDVNAVLNDRLQKKPKNLKMIEMAQKSARGDLTGFAGIFGISRLSDHETASLEDLLHHYATDEVDVQEDLQLLVHITSEVKAISNQAAILHGERIGRVHEVLTHYREGAFTSWLMTTYGNRQTPYNFWHYYQFYQAIPKELRPQLEAMPRQAVYSLASRDGELGAKQRIVRDYSGASKAELLRLIRDEFPLDRDDRRAGNPADGVIRSLKQVHTHLQACRRQLGPGQKREIQQLLGAISALIG